MNLSAEILAASSLWRLRLMMSASDASSASPAEKPLSLLYSLKFRMLMQTVSHSQARTPRLCWFLNDSSVIRKCGTSGSPVTPSVEGSVPRPASRSAMSQACIALCSLPSIAWTPARRSAGDMGLTGMSRWIFPRSTPVSELFTTA